MRMLVTGAFGFIGSHFIKYTLENYPDVHIVGFARDSSQKNKLRLADCIDDERLELVYGDLTEDISGILENIDIVVHFAARTFVDHSIKDPEPFIKSNILGTYNLLEQARMYKTKLWIQISTDEVYGAILEGSYKEDSKLNPTNVYAATKASADCLVMSYGNTYKLSYIITRTENNFGKFQHPQKVFPTFVRKALLNEKLPIYGDGQHVRQWLRVEDHCLGIWYLITNNVRGIYHIAGEQELQNLELAKRILKILGKSEDLIEFVPDFDIRPGHDRRYALDCTKLRSLGWRPKYSLEEGIKEVVEWYTTHPDWLT